MPRSGDGRRRIGVCAAAMVAAVTVLAGQAPPTPAPSTPAPTSPASTPPAQAPPGQPPPPDQPTPRFRTEADVIVVEATVLDRKGVVVTGLGPADFKVEISGKPRDVLSADLVEYETPSTVASPAAPPPDLEISTNEPKENGRVILLVIDQASLGSDTRQVIDSAKKWALALGPKDLLGLLTFPAPGPSVDFTVDHTKVADALGKVVGIGVQAPPFQQYNISIWEAIRMESQDLFVRGDVIGRECRASQPLCPTEIEMQVKTMVLDAQAQIQPVLRSLRATMRGLARVPGPKHAVLLSSGWAMNERDASTEMGWVAADAARANVTIHTFTAEMWALAASRSRPSMRSIEDRNLLMNNVEMLAGMTGGRSVRLTGQADTAFASLTAGLSGYYRLGVHALPEDLDGKDRRISLKLARPGLTLASYRRVLAGTRAETATPLDPESALREALKGGPPQTGVDLRATSYVLHATSANSRDLRVVAVGDVGRAAPGTAKAVAALYALDGKPVTAMENTVEIDASGPGVLSVELTAPPGAYVLRVAVRDADGKIGSLERLVDARWKKTGGIETPGLVLFRADRGVGAAPRPIFDHVTAAEDVIAQVALSGPVAEKKTQVVFEVSKAGGTTPLVRRTGRIAQTTGGTTVAQETLPASMLPPGRYTLSARIGGASTALTRAFTVIAAPAGSRAAAASAAGGAAMPAGSGVPAVSAARTPARTGTLSFATPRFTTSTVLDAAFVTPLIERLAARPDTAAVREAIEQAKAGPWPTDSAKGPLAQAPLAAHFVAGLGRLQAGDLEEAAQAFRAALRVAPDFAPSLIYLGACYAAGTKDQEAAGAWQMALVRERTSPELQRLAIEAWLRADKPAAALALLNQARQRWPDDDAFVRLQAQVALADGRQPEGIDAVAQIRQPDQATLLLALTALYDASRHQTPVWDAARDLETMRRLRDAYAAIQGESLTLVDAWLSEMAPAPRP